MKEERTPITRWKKVISNIANKIKGLFSKTETKQLTKGTENIKNTNGLKGLKVKLLSEMSNDEINKIMEDMEKDPWGTQQYEDEQLLEEVFKRIGADDELAKISAENDMVNQVWACHRTGKLETLVNGETVYNYEYTNEKGKYRTTIGCEDGVVIVDNKQYLDKEGNDVDIPEYYDYYMGDMDARFTNQVRICKNDFGGVTLENNERDRLEKSKFTSTIEFDSNNIQMKKRIQPFENAITILERIEENPFILKETYVGGDATPIISYTSVSKTEPDKLYSNFYSNKSLVENPEEVEIVKPSHEDIEKLKGRNPKAAKYFEIIGRDQQEK